ncbi:hypothetical protein ACFQY4_22275 [Catellatospora bangladeshensis]|uniref:hypothetical protein n=1 Tax=Catellatospora bangladeshensis TaxID=310355 RepID=UPI0036168D3B
MTDLPSMPFEQKHPLEPAPVLQELQEQGPVHRVRTLTGDEAWLVTGYEQVKALYSGDRLARAHPRPSRAPRLTASALFGGGHGRTICPRTPTGPGSGRCCTRSSPRPGCASCAGPSTSW